MAIPNPMAIDQAARHYASQIRLMAYASVVGQEGVLGNDHLRVEPLDTPGAGVKIIGGGYSILAKHLGGEYEAYVGKYSEAEILEIPPTTSSGSRTDLVITRVENPFVAGSGTWTQPADPINGPYVFHRLISPVAPTINSVVQHNSTWSAITLAKITRPANKSIVEWGDITNLRSLAELGGTRTVVEQVNPPPIAQSFYMETKKSQGDVNYPSSDTQHNYWTANTQWQNWPSVASWQVPIPSWAREMDIELLISNAQILFGDVFAELTLEVNGSRLSPEATIAVDYVDQPGRHVLPFSGTFDVPSSLRGKIITFRAQMRSYYNFTDNSGRRFDAKAGTASRLFVNFQRNPD